MKVFELIRALYEQDPDHEVELVVNQPVYNSTKWASFSGTKNVIVEKIYPSEVKVVTIEAYE